MSTDPADTQILVRPEVTAFVEEVRRLLADLDDETRDARTVGCPARNGDVAVYNVFPLDQLPLRRGTCDGIDEPDATRPDHPLASVPPVTVVRSHHDQPADPRSTPGPDQRERPGAR